MRVITYRLEPEDAVYTLVTTLLDPETAPAAELAALYHEWWEIETACDEIKTHLLGPGTLLRSKTPELVYQEMDGLLLAHYAVRSLVSPGDGEGRGGSGSIILRARGTGDAPPDHPTGWFFPRRCRWTR